MNISFISICMHSCGDSIAMTKIIQKKIFTTAIYILPFSTSHQGDAVASNATVAPPFSQMTCFGFNPYAANG